MFDRKIFFDRRHIAYKIPPLTDTIIYRELVHLAAGILDNHDYNFIESKVVNSDWFNLRLSSISEADRYLPLDDLTNLKLRTWAYELAIPMIPPEVLYYWAA